MKTPFLYVALDFTDKGKLYVCAEELAAVDSDRFGYKVNLDFLFLNGPDSIKPLLDMEKEVFTDLKMWNGRRTMKEIAKELNELGASDINAYSHAGVGFLSALKESLSDKCRLLAVTILTHYTDNDCQDIYGCGVKEAVYRLATIANKAECDGIILPGIALDDVKEFDMLKVVPGVRPEWHEDKKANYQESIITPGEAIDGGADILVCGSPITKSDNRKDALRRVLDEINP